MDGEVEEVVVLNRSEQLRLRGGMRDVRVALSARRWKVETLPDESDVEFDWKTA